ncbi:RHS repeat domain-containing protein [Pectobacterium versatile]|uniref:RHS repeat domain-containing protein n=1 Tax=Pectobacterium versatile TaxID=2488639 RepID=UPI0039F71116
MVQSGYDAGGQRAVVEGILAPLQLAWQSGRLSSLGIGSHQPLQFSHTAAGEEQRRTNGSGFALRHEWSPTGLLQRQALEGADGRVNDVLERHYQYDVLDRLTGISDSHWGEQAFRLNGAGQVTAERRDEGRRRQARLFGYDSEQNLCEVSQIAPGLGETLKVQDAVVQASARYDAAGRVVERGHTQYRYDDCGRLAMKRETRPGFRPKETYFDWDVQDRLIRVSLPDGARWRYRYDAFGRRVSKVREGQVPSTQAVARVAYRWDGDQLIGQQQYYADGSAAREVQWVYEPGSFRPLAQVEAQGDSTQLHYIVTDLTGTARELCSEEGEIRWRGEQGLWGAHREERRPIPLRRYLGDAANEEVYCELRYQGQLYDAETGLYYNRHRYYDAESGQYLSPDPIGLHGGIRPQGYVHNPLEWCDPFGLSLISPKTILFSQDSIAGSFSDGGSINELVHRLKNNPSYINEVEPIRKVRMRDLPTNVQERLMSQGAHKDSVFSLDNRRLYAAKEAGISKMPSRWATPEELAEINLNRRFSTETGGKGIAVRKACG